MFSLKDYNFQTLNAKNCHAFEADAKALSEKEVLDALEFLFSGFESSTARKNRWKITKIGDSMALNGRFAFDSYQKTFAFVSAIYLLGLEQHYYPDIMFGDGFCYITLFTIKLKGIHENDFIMLAKIESMISDQKNQNVKKEDVSVEKKKEKSREASAKPSKVKRKKVD